MGYGCGDCCPLLWNHWLRQSRWLVGNACATDPLSATRPARKPNPPSHAGRPRNLALTRRLTKPASSASRPGALLVFLRIGAQCCDLLSSGSPVVDEDLAAMSGLVLFLRWGRGAVGSAPRWHRGGRGFESHRLHQLNQRTYPRKPLTVTSCCCQLAFF